MTSPTWKPAQAGIAVVQTVTHPDGSQNFNVSIDTGDEKRSVLIGAYDMSDAMQIRDAINHGAVWADVIEG